MRLVTGLPILALALAGCALPDIRDEVPGDTDERCVLRMSELVGAVEGAGQVLIFGGGGQGTTCQLTAIGECPASLVVMMQSAEMRAGACALILDGTEALTPEELEALGFKVEGPTGSTL